MAMDKDIGWITRIVEDPDTPFFKRNGKITCIHRVVVKGRSTSAANSRECNNKDCGRFKSSCRARAIRKCMRLKLWRKKE